MGHHPISMAAAVRHGVLEDPSPMLDHGKGSGCKQDAAAAVIIVSAHHVNTTLHPPPWSPDCYPRSSMIIPSSGVPALRRAGSLQVALGDKQFLHSISQLVESMRCPLRTSSLADGLHMCRLAAARIPRTRGRVSVLIQKLPSATQRHLPRRPGRSRLGNSKLSLQ